ncbi:hypothetical protein COO20_04515 [Thalassospira marina]|uniref:Bro-N domain-containing protein n=2 Tax=Thalassospira marina TaxID=2048283 RepID=A0A2N3KXZ4_9PROT|nr:hypothetical protein COO20_04515 [Thalassospira marina]
MSAQLTLPESVRFQDTDLSIIDHNGTPWLTSSDLARALGYAHSNKITVLYNRVKDEFSDEMTLLLKLSTRGQVAPTKHRIFSPRGCHLIAMFARTERAKEFRKWVLDVLEGLAPVNPSFRPEQTRSTVKGGLTVEQQDEIKAMVKARADAAPKEHRASATIKCWSAIKKKFGCSYKDVPEHAFTDVVSLLARLELPGIAPAITQSNAVEPGLTRNGMAAMMIGGKVVIFDVTDIQPQEGDLAVFIHPQAGGDPFVSTSFGNSQSSPWGDRSTYLMPQKEKYGMSMAIALCLGKVVEVRGGAQ